MRKLWIILTIVFLTLSVIFVILPMGTIAFLPAGLSLVVAVLAYIQSEKTKRQLPLWLLIISIVLLLIASGKVLFIKNKVVNDQQFQQEQVQSTQEAVQELEDLDSGGGDSSAVTDDSSFSTEDADTTSSGGDDFGGGN